MAKDGNKKPSVRKLTVDNFSVIKHAELEFGKITVLIGPQASGKSLLCKLAYFMGREVIRIAIDSVVSRWHFSDFEGAIQKEFVRWFPKGGWGSKDWTIFFSSDRFAVRISGVALSEGESYPKAVFGDDFQSEYTRRLLETQQEQQKKGFLLGPALQSIAATRFMALAGRAVWDASTYIPLERSYFVDTKKGYRSLGSEDDPISAHFAAVYANCLNPASSKPRVSSYLEGDLVPWQNDWMVAFNDGRFLSLSHLSAGSKEILPIVAALDYYEYQRRQSGYLPSAELYDQRLYVFDDFTIEEPEASLFPKTQYKLIREFAGLSNEADFVPHFTITTHSPYILSSFNNLIEAGQAARNNPQIKDRIAQIVPEQYWIKEGDFKAYAIEDGKLESILNDSGFVEGNYLDQVSETIGDEFDKLLRLEYERTKAS